MRNRRMKTPQCSFNSIILLALILSTAISYPSLSNAADDSDLFTFVRLKYTGDGRWWRSGWDVDLPASDRNFILKLTQATDIPVTRHEKIISVGSPELFDYPFAYILEVGSLNLSSAEAANLREYLLRGGFIMVDDFHGGQEWHHFHRQLKKIFPEREPEDIPITHPLFHCFFDINTLVQIPGIRSIFNGRTYERRDGYPAYCRGVYDERGRLMMMINFNTDIGDAWEHAADDFYPRKYSDWAYRIGINAVVYALTH